MDKTKFLYEVLVPFQERINAEFADFYNTNMRGKDEDQQSNAYRGLISVLSYILAKLFSLSSMSELSKEKRDAYYAKFVDLIEMGRIEMEKRDKENESSDPVSLRSTTSL